MKITETALLKYAEIGAGMRLLELEAERQTILRTWPSLNGLPVEVLDEKTARRAAQPMSEAQVIERSRRKPKTQAQREAISRRMRAYWRARRAAGRKVPKEQT